MYDKDVRKEKNKIVGSGGEIIAVEFLRNKNFKILETNFSCKLGEIDIIAEKDGIIVFVEVKKRSTLAYGRPVEAVNFAKQRKIKKVAEIYLMVKHKNFADVRFDVIEIVGECVFHIENAFSDF